MNRLNFADLKDAVKTRGFEDMCVTYLGPDGPQTPKLPAKIAANGRNKRFDIGTKFEIYKDDNKGKDNVIVFKIGRDEYEMNGADFIQGAGLNQPIFSNPPNLPYCEGGGKKKRSKKRSLKKKQKKSARKSRRFYFF